MLTVYSHAFVSFGCCADAVNGKLVLSTLDHVRGLFALFTAFYDLSVFTSPPPRPWGPVSPVF